MTFVRFSTFLFLVFCGLFFFSSIALLNPVLAFTPNDPKFSEEWYLDRIGAPKAWDTTTGSSSIIIAVLDTGIESTHEDLQNMWVNSGETPGNGIDDDGNGYIDDDKGWDFYNGNNNPADDNGHGTHVAGVAGAATNNSKGVASIGYQAKLMNVKIANSSVNTTWQSMANGIYYAVNNGANIINISFGAPLAVGSSDYTTLYNAVSWAEQHNVLIVAIVGNNNTDMTSTSRDYPAYFSETFDNVISVAGSNKLDQKYSSSNYGNWVTVAAPAEGIKTTKLSYMSASCTSADGDYCTATLNSYAAPQVSGLASLVLAQHPTWTPSQVKDQIKLSTDPISGTGTYWDFGRINACKAVGRTDCDVQGGLVGYWKMDESSWVNDCNTSEVVDSSSNNNGGKTCPALTQVAPNTATGKYGNAGNFDGSNDFVSVPDNSSLRVSSDFSLGAWVYLSADTSTYKGVIEKRGPYGSGEYYIGIDPSEQVYFGFYNGGNFYRALSNPISVNAWHHLAGTFNDSSNELKLYIDGSLAVTQSVVVSPVTGTNPIRIGSGYDNTEFLPGKIDEVRVYNRSLSAAEVSSMQDPSTATTTGLIGYWPMNETSWVGDCATLTVLDSIGSNHGKACPVAYSGPTLTTGKFNTSASFDGVDDYISINDNSSLHPTALTISAWVNPSSSNATNARIVSKGQNNFRDFAIGKQNTKLAFFYYNSAGGLSLWETTDTWSNLVPSSQWTHIVVTYTSGVGSGIKMYVNGVQKPGAWTSSDGNSALNFTNQPLRIGSSVWSSAGTEFFNGKIDDVRVYNRALTGTEVSALYSITP